MTRPHTALLFVFLVTLSCTSAPAREAARPASAAADPSPAPEPDARLTEPDPPRPAFDGRAWRLPYALRDRMRGTTWKPGCPVPLDDLQLIRFDYWDFDGLDRRGPMVVHKDVAEDVLWVFERLFRARFPIKKVALAREFVPEEFEARISSPRSVTASFNCRPVVTPLGPADEFSDHAYGLAIDINPVQNPYVTADGFVRNRKSERYLDRSRDLPGMIHDGDVVVRSFAAIGWSWGGRWNGGKDYMHFALNR
jgi:hypothetical protein